MNAATTGTKDVTDPRVYLDTEAYNKLTSEQKQQRYQRKQQMIADGTLQQHNVNQTQTQQGIQAPPQVPPTIQVNAAQLPPNDDQSAVTGATGNPGQALRAMMSNAAARQQPPINQLGSDISINGSTYRRINATTIFRVNESTETRQQQGALMDGGADGSLADPNKMRIIEVDENNTVNVTGVTNHHMEDLQLGQGMSLLETADGQKSLVSSATMQYAMTAVLRFTPRDRWKPTDS